MKWSVSHSRIFFQCPRKWYYESTFGNALAKDQMRHEAFLLRQLQSIHAWRGTLVDQVITKFVVPKLNRHEKPNPTEVLGYADKLFQAQLAFARAKRYRSDGEDAENDKEYCALFELEYDGSLNEEFVERAKTEVSSSLSNLLGSRLIGEINDDCLYLIGQRSLMFSFANVTVQCTPDLIVFFKNKPPVIVDWKVEAPRHKEHWIQLGTYGLALSRANAHKDFPTQWKDAIKDPTKIGLIEFQLLRNKERRYFITEDDVVNIEDYIYASSNRMLQMLNGNGDSVRSPASFPTTKFADVCMRCKFRKICWKDGWS